MPCHGPGCVAGFPNGGAGPRRVVVWEDAGELEEAGEGFDFILLDHILLEFLCNQNISQKHFDLCWTGRFWPKISPLPILVVTMEASFAQPFSWREKDGKRQWGECRQAGKWGFSSFCGLR